MIYRVLLACCAVSVSLANGYCDEPSKATHVEFVIGDYIAAEGGTWQTSSSPVQGPFGIDFGDRGAMYIVELTSGRLLRLDANGELVTLSEHDQKGYSGDGGPVSEAFFSSPAT